MSWIYWKIGKIYSRGVLKNAIIFSSLQSELKSASYYQEMSFNMDIELTDILGSLKMTLVKKKKQISHFVDTHNEYIVLFYCNKGPDLLTIYAYSKQIMAQIY